MGLLTGKMDNPFRKKQKQVYREMLELHLGQDYFVSKITKHNLPTFSSRRRHSSINKFINEENSVYSYNSGIVKEKLDSKKAKSLLDKIKNAGLFIGLVPPPLVPKGTSYFSKNTTLDISTEEITNDSPSNKFLFEDDIPESSKKFLQLCDAKKNLIGPDLIPSIKRDDLSILNSSYQIKKDEQALEHFKEKRIVKETNYDPLKRPLLPRELENFLPYMPQDEQEQDEEEDEIQEENIESHKEFPALTEEMELIINEALSSNVDNYQYSNTVLAEIRSIRDEILTLTRKDIETLSGLNWLNDEVINFYMALIVERSKLDNRPSVFAFNTFFYPKLKESGHSALKRWTRKFDIFSYDFIFVPVHLGMHWCLAVIDFNQKKILYYDSMGGKNYECLQALQVYLQDESIDKKKKKFDTLDWILENAQNIPQQMNGSDCGMFTCKYAEYISRRAQFNFGQAHMPYFRRRMVYELLTKQLL